MADNQDQLHPRTDPELLRQLDDAETTGKPVEAVFILRRPRGGVLPPDEVEYTADQLIERAQHQTGSQVKDVNVFKNMGSLVVIGEPSLLRALLDQPEIEAGIANRQPGSVDLLGGPAANEQRNSAPGKRRSG